MLNLNQIEIIKTVGQGSFGRVVKVAIKGSESNKFYALKMIKESVLLEPEYLDAVEYELEIFLELSGQIFFPRLYDTFYIKNRLCLLTDYCEGGELLTLIHRHDGFNYKQIRFYGAEILCALEILHEKNILYRDLKSENVLITKNGHINLIDFGFSIKTKSPVNHRVGTLECMSPEVLKEEDYFQSVDFWAFGVLLYEMYFKQTPFLGCCDLETEYNIVNHLFDYENVTDPIFLDLLGSLFNPNIKCRLGCTTGVDEIKKHPFFKGIDWNRIRNMEIKAPINCNIINNTENYPVYKESISSLFGESKRNNYSTINNTENYPAHKEGIGSLFEESKRINYNTINNKENYPVYKKSIGSLIEESRRKYTI